ncbi:hypothetical protein ACJX0J_017525, partial [Zea mays]
PLCLSWAVRLYHMYQTSFYFDLRTIVIVITFTGASPTFIYFIYLGWKSTVAYSMDLFFYGTETLEKYSSLAAIEKCERYMYHESIVWFSNDCLAVALGAAKMAVNSSSNLSN